MENRVDLEKWFNLNMLKQLDSCTCSSDIKSSFDFYVQYELDQVDHKRAVFV